MALLMAFSMAALTACGSSEKTARSVLPRDAFLRESTI
ncbi:unknown [Clostridium sp. CAG:7]|nr:unknown [Clostridium sp. CAG:7]